MLLHKVRIVLSYAKHIQFLLCEVLVSLQVDDAGLGGGGMSSRSAISLLLSLAPSLLLLLDDEAFTDDTVSGDWF